MMGSGRLAASGMAKQYMDMEWDGWGPVAWRRAVGSVGGGGATAQWPSAVETGLARSRLARSGASLGADHFIEPLVDPHLGGHVDPFVHARPGP